MRTRQPTTTLEDQRIPVRVKLAAAWTSFMFLYVYVDYFALYKPGGIGDILDGVVYEFQISQTLLTVFLASIAVPTLMILLSTTLPAWCSRREYAGRANFRESYLAEIVLCSVLVYATLARLQRTNSPATRLQQPVAPRNKSSQQV
jgi:hypothetical protein